MGAMSTATHNTTSPFERAKDEVADKVRKLLTQAEDTATTPEEAQAFTMKAQQLMTKYSIDLAMVTDASKADQLVVRGWTVANPYATHRVSLINAVARANDCRAIYSALPGGRKHIEVVGYPADVEWVETLSSSLNVQLAGALVVAMHHKPRGVHGRTFSVGFVQGFTAEVDSRLHQAQRQAVAAAEAASVQQRGAGGGPGARDPGGMQSTAGSVALVLVAKKERVDAEFGVRYPASRVVHQQVRLQSWSGYAPGRAAGSRASLARGSIGGSRRSLSA